MLNDSEIERYSRQLILGTWSTEKQLLIKDVSIRISGELEATARYLAALGFGRLHIHSNNDSSLVENLTSLNPDISVTKQTSNTTCDFAIEKKGSLIQLFNKQLEVIGEYQLPVFSSSDINIAPQLCTRLLAYFLK